MESIGYVELLPPFLRESKYPRRADAFRSFVTLLIFMLDISLRYTILEANTRPWSRLPPRSERHIVISDPYLLPCLLLASSAWTTVDMFASYDSKVVYRSGSILGYPDTFRYKQVAGHKVRTWRVMPWTSCLLSRL